MNQDNHNMTTTPLPPRVSVVMSVYNGERYIRQAVESILNQTFGDFELLLIDDGSTDQTPAILKSFNDPRIVRITHPANLGLVTALKEGVEQARGELIARMDADDISSPDRFAKQIAFLDAHPEVGVLGTAMRQVDSRGRLLAIVDPPTDHALIEWMMLFESPVMHATVMMRRAIVVRAGNYNLLYRHIEDGELWSRMITITRFANLPEVLYVRRWGRGSVSYQQATLQRQRGAEIRLGLLQRLLGRALPNNLVVAHLRVWSHPVATLPEEIIRQFILLLLEASQKLIVANQLPPESDGAQELRIGLANRVIALSQRDRRWTVKLIYRWLRAYLPHDIKNWANHLIAQRRFRG